MICFLLAGVKHISPSENSDWKIKCNANNTLKYELKRAVLEYLSIIKWSLLVSIQTNFDDAHTNQSSRLRVLNF